MRNFCVAAAALSLLASSAFAADAPLAPGKPAGARAAQEDNTILYIVGVGAIVAGVVILASNNGNGNTNPGTVGTTGTSS